MGPGIPVLENFPLDSIFTRVRAARCSRIFDRALLDALDARFLVCSRAPRRELFDHFLQIFGLDGYLYTTFGFEF